MGGAYVAAFSSRDELGGAREDDGSRAAREPLLLRRLRGGGIYSTAFAPGVLAASPLGGLDRGNTGCDSAFELLDCRRNLSGCATGRGKCRAGRKRDGKPDDGKQHEFSSAAGRGGISGRMCGIVPGDCRRRDFLACPETTVFAICARDHRSGSRHLFCAAVRIFCWKSRECPCARTGKILLRDRLPS